MKRILKLPAIALGALALTASLPAAAEGGDTGWKDTAEFSFVTTSGNSESSTLGFKNVLSRAWDRSSFAIRAGGIRVETTTTSRTALVDAANPSVVIVDEEDFDATTAEAYYLGARYDRKITDRFFWYTGLGWDRNRFAGIQNRYTAVGGVGNIWYDTDNMKFKTDYAVTFTDQEDVFTVAGVDDSFLGLRFSWDYWNKLGANTEYVNSLIIDENLDETSDFRADMINSLAVAMNSRLALKVSLQLLYDNEPSFVELVATEDTAGNPVTPVSTPFELDDLDTIFTVSLVVNF